MMLNRRAGSLLAFLLMVAACAPEPTGPGKERAPDGPVATGPAAAGNTAELEALIRQKLDELATLTPPAATAYQALFTNLLTALASNPGEMGTKLAALLQFIDNHAGNAPEGSPLALLRDQVIRLLYTLVGLDPDATICVLPAGHPSSVCVTPNPDGLDNAGFVYIPPALFEAMTFVSIKALDNTGVGSGLDEYGYALEIRTAPVATFPLQRPTVVACVPDGLPAATLNRLLIGHRRAASKYEVPPFSLLPDAGIETDAELLGHAENFCGKPGEGAPASVFGAAPDSRLGRILARAADVLLPRRLLAANAVVLNTRGFSGAAGSPEEFSTFRAVDRGVTGAGGSPEEFAPATTGDPTGEFLTGEAGTTATEDLPFVIVQTPAGGFGVNGVKVTFTVGTPTRRDGDGNLLFTPASEAALCEGATEVTVTTGGVEDGAPVGIAVLPCLSFGTKAGYANIKATFDPSQVFTDLPVSEQPCMIGAGGDCNPAVSQNFLVMTRAGPAAQIAIVAGDNQVAPAYTAVPVAPTVVVKDQYGNVVAGATVSWSANVGTILPNAGAGSEATGTTQTGSDGHTALLSWVLGAGPNTLLAEINGGEQSVQFNAMGTFGLSLDNACVTGGHKDDITKFRFSFPHAPSRAIRAIGLHLSSNGAPGQSENYEVTLTATRVLSQQGGNPAVTESRTTTARLQSSSNSSKGAESEVIFDFGSNPLPPRPHNANSGRVTVHLSVVQIVNGVAQPLAGNRLVNMNAGSCPAGQLNCNQNQRRVAAARTCDQTEIQVGPPLVLEYRRAFAGRIYTSP